MDPLTLSALAPLAIEWFKERRNSDRSADAVAFREWLETQVFPELLSNSAKALQAVINLKASENERFEIVLAKLAEIRAAVAGPTPLQQLDRLEAVDRELLRYMYESSPDDNFDRHFELGELSNALGVTQTAVLRAARMLEESSYARVSEASGHCSIRLTTLGNLFAWEALYEGDLEETSKRLGGILSQCESGMMLGKLATESDTPLRLAVPIAVGWRDEGLLKIRERDGGEAIWLVYEVAEQLRRRYAVE
jgi:DNA-binding Lrp family transcriptional regulator